ncbi:TadE family type IV pilus minor pilin [Saccharomonospora sp. NPDC046836]|uniref:TadE family type IV pilus minor pilin n=1 Tax=Saccharomonospora sp. NPDC046836 TaxID=3156921 RepID=UPI0033F77C10
MLLGADRDRGATTVEGAIGLCALVLVFGLVLTGVSAVTDQVRCTDAATEAARLLARGQRPLAEEAVRRLGPKGATVDVRSEGSTVAVVVSAGMAGGLLPGISIKAAAYAELEPGAHPVGTDAAPSR